MLALHNFQARWRGTLPAETLLVGVLALLALALAWQAPGPITVDIGKPDDIFLTNFEGADTVAGRDYRWSTKDSSLHFPGLGGRAWQVTLVATAGARPTGPPRLIIRAGGDPVLQVPAVAADWQTYTFQVPARDLPAGDLDLALDIPVFHPVGDPRELGLAIDSVTLDSPAPRLPAPITLFALAGALAVGYATCRLGGSIRASALATGAATLALGGLVAGARLSVTPYASYLLMIALLLFAGLYTLRATLRRYVGHGPLPQPLPAPGRGWGRGP